MKLQKVIFFLLMLVFTHTLHAKETQKGGIHWMTDFDKAVELSKSTSRPIFLFFTGSDWCGWCNKLEKEILETSEFVQTTSDKLIFVKLDYPMKSQLDPNTAKQNQSLQEKYAVRSFPTVIIVDSEQQPIGVTGYRAGGGKQYSAHIMKMVNEYSAYKMQMRQLGAQKLSGKELKRLYQKAHELSLESDKNALIKVGMDSDLAHFFLGERYRSLVTHGQIKSDEAVAIKQRLLDSDPTNEFLTHYQVAVIDYESYSEAMENSSIPPEVVVEPLISYINKFGKADKENLWRLNMVVSQVYLDKNQKNEALKYAQASYDAAPTTIQPDIAMAIKNIQKQLDSQN